MKGSILKRVGARGTTYKAMWRDQEGRQHKKSFKRRKDADAFLVKTVSAVDDGTFRKAQPAAMKDVFDRWIKYSVDVRLKQGNLKPSTAKSYRSMLKVHLRPAFDSLRSNQITHHAIDNWIRDLADRIEQEQISPKTYNNLLNLLKAILAWARHPARAYLTHDPLMGQKRLRVPKQEREFLEPGEITALLKAASPPDDTIIRLAVYSGLRRGELFALQWQDIDFGTGKDGGRVHVRRGIYQGAVSTPKTRSSIRVVDIPQSVVSDLSVYRQLYPGGPEDYLFRSETGGPMDPDNWRNRRYHPLLDAAGLRRVPLHALRHSYASLLINAGENLKYVSHQMGHASIQITADLYGHLFRETGASAMARLDEQITASVNVPVVTTSLPPKPAQDGRTQRSRETKRGNILVTNHPRTGRKAVKQDEAKNPRKH